MKQQRQHPEAGIAIGVILFILAVMAGVTVALTSGNVMTSSSISIDRVAAEVKSQGQLILVKIRECYTTGLADKQVECSNNTLLQDGNYSRSGCLPEIDKSAFYPTSTGSGTLVESLECPSYSAGSQNLWLGQAPATLPPPTSGMDKWVYVNADDSGGRCIRIQPSVGNTTDPGIKNGLLQASGAFSASELTYTEGSASQRFILWVTRPTVAASADCTP